MGCLWVERSIQCWQLKLRQQEVMTRCHFLLHAIKESVSITSVWCAHPCPQAAHHLWPCPILMTCIDYTLWIFLISLSQTLWQFYLFIFYFVILTFKLDIFLYNLYKATNKKALITFNKMGHLCWFDILHVFCF